MVQQSMLLEHLEGSVFEPLVHFLRLKKRAVRDRVHTYLGIYYCKQTCDSKYSTEGNILLQINIQKIQVLPLQ